MPEEIAGYAAKTFLLEVVGNIASWWPWIQRAPRLRAYMGALQEVLRDFVTFEELEPLSVDDRNYADFQLLEWSVRLDCTAEALCWGALGVSLPPWRLFQPARIEGLRE